MVSDIPLEISRLSNREADRVLADARRSRLAAIDNYWALSCTDPERAAKAAAGAPPIVGDIFLLARNRSPAPKPGAVEALSKASARLLEVKTIRDALPDDAVAAPADVAAAVWEDGRIVGLKMVAAVRVLVLRYDGPLFNPGTVPESGIAGGPDCYLVCRRGNDGNGGEYEFLTAYVLGSMDASGDWKPVQLDLASRSDLMRDLPAMEALVETGCLGEDYPDPDPLPAFPTGRERLIAQLQVHKAMLRLQGAATAAQQAAVDRQTRPLHERAARVRQRVKRLEDELHRIRSRIAHIEACALEAETGFARADHIRHRSTGDEGRLEIVHSGGAAQFRLLGTRIYVTEDIRRGEWEKGDVDHTSCSM